MSEIKDFPCTHENAVGIQSEITQNLNLTFPDAYLHHETMEILAKAIKKQNHADFCELPFCHTVEGEAMGGIINYGNEIVGPRAGSYLLAKPEEILGLPDIDFKTGRIHEVLLACQTLIRAGEPVVLDVSGPFTILNTLIDARYVFKALRKQPELMKQVFQKLGNNILAYMQEAQKYGVQMISYADSSGGVNILGPKTATQIVDDFTYDFLKKADKLLDKQTLILLCPKTTFALLGTEKAVLTDQELSGPVSYIEGCIQLIGKTRFTGQTCVKNTAYRLEKGVIKTVNLI